MTPDERRRYLILAQAAAHLRGAAGLLHDVEPELARRLSGDADRLYAEAEPLLRLADQLAPP